MNQQPKSCLDLRCRGFTQSGVYTIYPEGSELYSFDVYCDQKTDGGGWTVSNSTKAKLFGRTFVAALSYRYVMFFKIKNAPFVRIL